MKIVIFSPVYHKHQMWSKTFLCLMSLFIQTHTLYAQKEGPVPETFSNAFGGDSQEFASRTPPHGGKVFNTDKYQFEFVMDPFGAEQKLTMYILNRRYKTQRFRTVTVSATVNYVNGTVVKKEMLFKEYWYYCDLEDIINPCNIIVTIIKGKKKYTATYYFEGLKR